jgi:hypothetical protein
MKKSLAMKTRNLLIAALSLLLLSSCSTVTYFGDQFAPTSSIDIYYSAHDVKKDYKVIGHLSYVNELQADQEQVKAKLSGYAKKIGADAIIILGTSAVQDAPDGIVKADALKYN